ncbi:pyridoxal phosphate-dependent transferase [Nemania sp. FL0031]|nr:pyridoxal phosphate-dependent transferase [Nemania sp. FL0031]
MIKLKPRRIPTSLLKSHNSKSKRIIRYGIAHGRSYYVTTITVGTPLTPASPLSIAKMTAGQSMSGANEMGQVLGSQSQTGTSAMGNKKPINLLRGWPSTSLLPAAALRAASETALSDPAIWAPGLEYGPDSGYQPLREALAGWLGQFYSSVLPIAPDDSSKSAQGKGPAQEREDYAEEKEADRITITGGASQSLACILQSFTDPAQTLAIWVVAPCYFLACPIFADAGFAGRMRAVPEDEEGVDLEVLEREMGALEEREGANGRVRSSSPGFKDPDPYRKIYRHVVYCVPSFSNPSGRTMTLARRKGLVEVARCHDALVICDDVYDMLQWRVDSSLSPNQVSQLPKLTKALLPRVADLDLAAGRSPHDPDGKHFGHAVSNGSFSKIVAPGTRTGWTYSTSDFAYGMSQTGSTRSGGAASQLAATIICELLQYKKTKTHVGGSTSTHQAKTEEECLLDAHLRHTLLPAYARRHALLMRTVHAELAPLGLRVRESSLSGREDVYGGYFVWMPLPHPSSTSTSTSTTSTEIKAWPTAQAIADRCSAEENLKIGNGELFAVHGDEDAARFEDAIRFCFAWLDEEDLVDGVQRLGRVIRKMLDEGPESWVVVDRGVNSSVDEAK